MLFPVRTEADCSLGNAAPAGCVPTDFHTQRSRTTEVLAPARDGLDLVRLHVAVDDVAAVGGGEGSHRRNEQLERSSHRHWCFSLHQSIERLTAEQLHRDVALSVTGVAAFKDRDGVGMIERAGNLRFSLEALAHFGTGFVLTAQQLERDLSSDASLGRDVDLAHVTEAERFTEHVLVAEDSLVDHKLRAVFGAEVRLCLGGDVDAMTARTVLARRCVWRLELSIRAKIVADRHPSARSPISLRRFGQKCPSRLALR